jgi:glycolate oxidase FAD binding subunit
MPAPLEIPIARRVAPVTRQDVADAVRDCFESATPIYPLGGETSLDFSMPVKAVGLGLGTSGLHRVVDFPARDMTITAEAGITLAELLQATSKEGLQFPVDVPFPEKATLGGVVATNWNGPRRYGYGLVRDYVIGIRAVDGTGTEFKGGGRVVKNVAGYDFCKLLTGSMGTLGVITEITLKLKPIAPSLAWLIAELPDFVGADQRIAELIDFPAVPASICLLVGEARKGQLFAPNGGQVTLAIGFEGARLDVDWAAGELSKQIPGSTVLRDGYGELLQEIAHFPADVKSPLSIRAAVVPSGVRPFMEAALQIDPKASILAHAGSGIVYVKFSEFPAGGLSKALVGNLHGVAQRHHGNVVILSNPSGAEMTHQAVFGGDANWRLMQEVKRRFDPKNILNPGRLFSA